MGTLFLVGTPIGNLGDISQRALEILNQADLIACEDTRQTVKLLNHIGIHKALTSYHEFNEQTKAEELAEKLTGDMKIVLVSDAGMPAISDQDTASSGCGEKKEFLVLPSLDPTPRGPPQRPPALP